MRQSTEKDIDLKFLTSTFFRRLVLVLLPFTAIVVYGYSELIVASMKAAENRTVQEYLRSEYALFERRYAESPMATLPSSDNLAAWWEGDAQLPKSFVDLEPGIHALDHSQHLLIGEPNGAGRRAYFVLSEPQLGSSQMIRSEMESTIYLAAMIVFLSGALLAVIVARWLSRPIRALADDVRAPRKSGKPLQGHNRNDEIGLLSRALGELINRMESALVREKAVTRYASHDMRTPVSVIRIALSVLKMPGCDKDTRRRNLQRIDDACAEIEERIEVHLCLARDGVELPQDDCDIRAMIEDEVAKYSHVIDARNLRVSIDGSDTRIRTTRSMLRVVLSNLIQNAVSYAGRSIDVDVDADRISIRNSIAETDSHPGSDGLGLEIVQRVCDRLGWDFTAQPQGAHFKAQVKINTKDN